MRAIIVIALAAVLATISNAQVCADVAGDPFQKNGDNCTAKTTCGVAACSCIGGTVGTNGCNFPTSLTCDLATTCLTALTLCELATTVARNNASDACMAYGNQLYIAQLAAVASPVFNQSALYGGCANTACQVMNQTGIAASCGLAAAVCSPDNLLPSATGPTMTLSPTQVADLIATLRLSGSNWSAVLNDPTLKANLITSLSNDLATLLGIAASYIEILSLLAGSLVVNFAVLSGSGKSPSQLNTAVNTATTSTTWLASTQSVYSQVSTETLTALSVSVTQTGSPAPPPSSATGVAGMWMVAAVAAVAALWA